MTPKQFTNKFEGISFDIYGVRLPKFKPKEKKELNLNKKDNLSFLKALCSHGLQTRPLINEKRQEYVDRAKDELRIIEELGFVDYILLVYDVINYCADENIPTGLGRGSAAGSLVLYLIGVTHVDPIKYGLYFERFISKTRAKKQIVDGITYLDGELMCDVDIDVCYYNRPKVLQYLEEKFKGKTAKILTLNTLTSKLLIKECGKVVASKDETEMNTVSSYIPKVFGKVQSLDTAVEEVPEFRDWCDKNQNVYNVAKKLGGLIKNKGVHPSGVLLSYKDLESSCPVELSSDKDPVSGYDMNWVSLSNVKLDILGLRSVSVVDQACKEIGINVTDIDLEDPFIYQKLQDLRSPHGIFQIEADANFRVCQKVKPKNLEQLSAVLALARPGALAFVDQYANYSNNDVCDTIHPVFDDILSTTGGVCLYQEQMMQMAHKIGFTLDEAEILRRIVGKKKVAEVKKWKKKIAEKVKQNNLDPDVGDVLWKVLEDSANYSFNKSHSLAYACLAASTVYLKFKYPKEFFLALLKMTRHEPDPVKEISKIAKEFDLFGIELLPPHIVKSALDFKIEGDDIRFGLLSIKGISDKSIDKLMDFRKDFATKFEIFQGAKEAGISSAILCPLIQAGALEGFKQSRTKVVYEAQVWNLLTDREKRFALPLGEKFDYDLVRVIKHLNGTIKDDKGKQIIKDSRLATIKRKQEPYEKIYQQNRKNEQFANWYYENHLLGYTHGVSLRDIFAEKRDGMIELSSVREVENMPLKDKAIFVGTISDKPYKGKSRRGASYLRLEVADETGVIRVMIFNEKLERCERDNEGLPKEGNIVIIKGVKVDEAVFADMITIQDNKVYTKLSQIKNS
jgi:DNA polymerase-3 subunit alpha